MNNKTLIGGAIALGIIALLVISCLWAGNKIRESISGTNNTADQQGTNETQNQGPREPPPPITNPEEAQRVYLALGNPSNAAADSLSSDNYLVVRNSYALSYNSSRGISNWVAWRISANDLGAAGRQNNFRPDAVLPKNLTRVTPTDYTGSGFDRGHLCPSADRSSSEQANSETFLMTNIAPQTPDLNREVWENLESYSRTLVKKGKVDLYIIAGAYGEKGKLKKKVTIPTNFWKVIVAIPQGGNVSAINENTHIIAVDMPNATGIANNDWRQFRTTVRTIE
ncbi:MAG: DNA/RNA non-specific endonuclease, partial [Pyrinomonadaceae bacterium]